MHLAKIFTLASLIAIAIAFTFSPALAGPPIIIGDYVWFDANGNGLQDDGDDAGINDVRVILYRDYDCNGLIDGSDEIFDYDYTTFDEFGLPGYYEVPAIGGRCYVAFLDEATVPEELEHTTPANLGIPTFDVDYLDADFGLGFEQQGPDFVCPKTIGFWKQQFKQKRSAKYSQDELNLIVEVALGLTPVFDSYDDFEYYLNVKGRAGALARATRQFAAFTLNLAAYLVIDEIGFPAGLGDDVDLDLYLTDAPTVGDAYAEVEAYILSGENLGLANDIADAINNGEGLELKCEL